MIYSLLLHVPPKVFLNDDLREHLDRYGPRQLTAHAKANGYTVVDGVRVRTVRFTYLDEGSIHPCRVDDERCSDVEIVWQAAVS